MTSFVEGRVSPLELNGRSVSPHLSTLVEIEENGVMLKERTSAQEGIYSSREMTDLSSIVDRDVNAYMDKPIGTTVYNVNYYEQWPVSLTSIKEITYYGKEINDRDFEGNNHDFVGTNILYNRVLSKTRRSVMKIDRMNATVHATDDEILSVEFQPTKYLGYLTDIHSTGIVDLSYKQTGSSYDTKRQTYSVISNGNERYYGTFNITRLLEMRSIFNSSIETELEPEYLNRSLILDILIKIIKFILNNSIK